MKRLAQPRDLANKGEGDQRAGNRPQINGQPPVRLGDDVTARGLQGEMFGGQDLDGLPESLVAHLLKTEMSGLGLHRYPRFLLATRPVPPHAPNGWSLSPLSP